MTINLNPYRGNPGRMPGTVLDGIRLGYARIVSEDGAPAPCLRIERGGQFSIRLAVAAGARTITAQAKQPVAAAARPVLRVRVNPAIGLNADVTASATANLDWQPVSVTFTAASAGGVVVVLQNPDQQYPCWWDEIRVT